MANKKNLNKETKDNSRAEILSKKYSLPILEIALELKNSLGVGVDGKE